MLKILFRTCVFASAAFAAALAVAKPSPQALFRIQNDGNSGAQANGISASVAPPVLSFIVDTTQGVRPVIGIPGAASIINPLELGFPVVRAAVATGQDYVLATTTEGGWPTLLQLRGGTIIVRSAAAFADSQQRSRQVECEREADTPLGKRLRMMSCSNAPSGDDSGATIDRIALSSSGSAVALFSDSRHLVFAFTNLSQSPMLVGKFQVGELGTVSAFAISDDGRSVVVGVSNGDAGGLFLLAQDHPAQLIAQMRHPSAIAFLRNSQDAVIADDVENKVYMLSQGQVFPLATAESGIAGPVGIAVSGDNRKAFIGNRQSGSVMTIALNGTIEGLTYCNCTLTGLHATRADSVFRLSDFSGGPILLFDGTSTPRMIFVPMSNSHF
jgi:hypothetical protein